ncbi:MAG: 50S ribosomal protein L3 [Verrucomicrobiales bacterium]
MSLGLLGKKLGMTRIYTDKGEAVAVTVVDVSENDVLQVRTPGTDGYSAVQVGFRNGKAKHLTKQEQGHCQKHGAPLKRHVREFRLAEGAEAPASGSPLTADLFQKGQYVDVIGVSKGRGFQGVVKRYGFAGQPASHGSMMHRRTGSIGCRLTPGRVWKNQKMPGHMGQVRRTIQNLQIVETRSDDHVILIRGSFPGAKGDLVVIRPAKKKPAPAA